MKPATTLALVALATSLGGCKSFVQAFDFSRHSSAPQYAIGEADLEEGKDALRAGAAGNALSPLHRAALNPQTCGEALNALGVAYARLGRGDLAERYFIAATRVDADNERFAANLDRFYRSDLSRSARALHAQRQTVAEAFAEYAQSEAAVPAEPVADTRVVESGGEKRTITLSGPATSTRVSTSSPAPVRTAATPIRVRISGEAPSAPQTARPAEMRIGSAAPAMQPRVRVGVAQGNANYPVRVTLPARRAGSDKN
ncbi:hypothetical protein K3148_04150 [Qipengyuania aurantiaca]|uniref:Tetratricopeptide repeat protein n=1 Tax=Qipengyuania aurantiaca TaxID=2867233 RepID=A0ABX8ZNK3_9SPHN|nr:hypothetical protein [Qipengyuania aurantiaca]QZD90593.1 hypothetical protein K3148_04150 [Qipengyuania aurantiaca]